MQKIGLTGGIGSGKTTVAKVFEMLGVSVYYADKEAKRLMHENKSLRKAIQNEFGQNIYQNEILDRKKLAEVVFHNSAALERLNDLVHPVVRQDFVIWTTRQKSPYVIEESAILFETGLYKDFDKIISVLCPLEERMQRVLQRDGVTREQIEARMTMQIGDEERYEKSDFVLKNGKDDLLLPQIIEIDNVLRK